MTRNPPVSGRTSTQRGNRYRAGIIEIVPRPAAQPSRVSSGSLLFQPVATDNVDATILEPIHGESMSLPPPTISGLSHSSLSVRDLELSLVFIETC